MKTSLFLVSLAAAVAAGCVPCAGYYTAKARGAGRSEDDLSAAISVAVAVRRAATDAVVRAVRNDESSPAGEDETSSDSDSRLTLLQSVSAAYAVNSERLLGRLLDGARARGISIEALLACVQIARDVRGMAIRIADARVEKAGGPGAGGAEAVACTCG